MSVFKIKHHACKSLKSQSLAMLWMCFYRKRIKSLSWTNVTCKTIYYYPSMVWGSFCFLTTMTVLWEGIQEERVQLHQKKMLTLHSNLTTHTLLAFCLNVKIAITSNLAFMPHYTSPLRFTANQIKCRCRPVYSNTFILPVCSMISHYSLERATHAEQNLSRGPHHRTHSTDKNSYCCLKCFLHI